MSPRVLGSVAAILVALPWATASADTPALRSQLALATEANDLPARIELLRRLADAEPHNLETRTELIEFWTQLGDGEMALATLDAWPGTPPASLAVRTRAAAAVNADHPDQAIALLTDHLVQQPDDVPALAAIAALQAPAAALATLNHLADLAPTAARLFDRAFAKRAVGDYPGAIADARAAAKLDPELAASMLPRFDRLATVLGSIERLDARLAKDPDSLPSRLLRAHYFASADLPELSLADAARALALAPGSFSGLILRARALNALDQLASWQASDRDGVDVSTPLPSDQTAAALIDLDVALLADPGDASLFADRAAILSGEFAQYRLALIAADQALAIDPSNSQAALAGILAATLLSDSDEGTARLRAFEATKPDTNAFAEANALVADAFFRSSDIPLALAFADRSLVAESTPRMIQLKAGCLQRLGRGAEAQALLNQ